MADAADKAHLEKEAKTGAGERMVPHATFTDGDRELRTEADQAETERVEAFVETGYVAAPNTGDFHAARRAAKLATAGGMEVEDPSSVMVDQVREGREAASKDAAKLRRAAGSSRSGVPAGRRSVPTATTGGDTPSSTTDGGPGAANQTGGSGSDGSGDANTGDTPAPAPAGPATKATPAKAAASKRS